MRIHLCLGVLLLLAGCGSPSFLITPVTATYQLNEVSVKEGTGVFAGKIAIIPVEGTLINDRGGLLGPGDNPLSLFVQQLDIAAADDSVKAVVLRINSPGGSVTTSDTMYDALMRFRAKTHKPVIACAEEVDASGAYYLSCGCDKIVASPTSLVGCIGVIFESFDLAGTMEKLGIQSKAIKSGEYKDMGSPFRAPTQKEIDLMQGMVNQYFGRFKDIVKKNRPAIPEQSMDMVTDGRIFSGIDSKGLGLVDELGQLDDAIDMAREMAKSPGAEVIIYKHPYGYTGSIYADTSAPRPQSSSGININLPLTGPFLPSGFYYLWQP